MVLTITKIVKLYKKMYGNRHILGYSSRFYILFLTESISVIEKYKKSFYIDVILMFSNFVSCYFTNHFQNTHNI